jgi:hypothetical protein
MFPVVKLNTVIPLDIGVIAFICVVVKLANCTTLVTDIELAVTLPALILPVDVIKYAATLVLL